MNMKPNLKRLPFCRELKKMGFKRVDNYTDPLIYNLDYGNRTINVQLWKDGQHRASHYLNNHGTTVPTDFTTVDGMKLAILHELLRMDQRIRA